MSMFTAMLMFLRKVLFVLKLKIELVRRNMWREASQPGCATRLEPTRDLLQLCVSFNASFLYLAHHLTHVAYQSDFSGNALRQPQSGSRQATREIWQKNCARARCKGWRATRLAGLRMWMTANSTRGCGPDLILDLETIPMFWSRQDQRSTHLFRSHLSKTRTLQTD